MDTACELNPEWDLSTLLSQNAWYFLDDVKHLLDLSDNIYMSAKLGYIGILKHEGRWLINLAEFAPYYRKYYRLPTRLPSDVSPENIIYLEGIYFLSEVCTVLGLDHDTLVKDLDERFSSQKQGIWYSTRSERYVVSMRKFSAWMNDKRNYRKHSLEPIHA